MLQIEISPVIIPLLLCSMLSAGLAVYALRHRSAPAATAIAALLVEITLWTAFHLLEFVSVLPEQRLLWARAALLALVWMAPTWVMMTIQYSRGNKAFTPLQQAALFMVPALTLAVGATGSWHNLLWAGTQWDGVYRHLIHPGWLWLISIYSYGIVTAGFIWLIYLYVRSTRAYRKQLMLVVGSGLLPFLINIYYVFGYHFSGNPTILPFLFAISATACAAVLMRFRYLDLVPVAHDLVIRSLSDGLITLDGSNRILEINPAGMHILGLGESEVVGQAGLDVLGEWFDRIVLHGRKQATPEEITLGKGLEERQYDVMSAPLIDRRGNSSGSLVILRDITRRKRMEQAEREQRFLAEALRDTVAALNSTLEITEVLDSILSNVERVVPHKSASIMLIEAGIARVARGRGYKELGIWDFIKAIKFRVSDMPNLRWMMETGQPYVVAETADDKDWISFPETSWVRSNVCAPIIIKGITSGFINLDSDVPGFFNEVHAERLQAFANQSAIALDNARLYRELQQLASTDELTSLFNRRRFFELGHSEMERSQRFGHPLTLMIMDADHFKRVNDTLGHMVGDQVLRGIARRCRANLRNIDIVARYGGDEFVFLLLESDEATALSAAQRILSAITSTPFDTDGGPVNLTVSIGLAQFDEHTRDLTTMIKHADQALYRAKQTGRNMICVWEYRSGVEQSSNPASSTRPVQRPFGL